MTEHDPAADRREFEYDAFGVNYGDEQVDAEEFMYTGKPMDAVSGQMDYGFRDYRPQYGRFATVDPIKDGSNWYAYVENDPVNMVDRLGLDGENASDHSGINFIPDSGAPGYGPEAEWLSFDVYDGRYHCNQLAWNQAIERGYNPGPNDRHGNDIHPGRVSPGNAYNVLVNEMGVDHPSTPIENTAGYAYMQTEGAIVRPGYPQPTHVTYYEYEEGDIYTLYWTQGNEEIQIRSINMNTSLDPQLPVNWIGDVEFLPLAPLNDDNE